MECNLTFWDDFNTQSLSARSSSLAKLLPLLAFSQVSDNAICPTCVHNLL
ncbi:MAG: hypothetical protein OFPI_26230 [Osedax symbiont Rs2]|nr:MAG: hypothetical protein OFPI_26230 [Osedax symbiont Rs2]